MPEQALRKTYPQNWPVYNLAQTKEKMLFLKIINESVNSMEIPYEYKGDGRPHYPIDDMIKVCCIKVFNNFSSRRSVFELHLAYALGYIRQIPHFNSISNYLNKTELTSYLHKLYKTIALPLVDAENVFAIDSTGFGTFNKKKWMDVRLEKRLWKEYRKLHIVTGVKTNLISSAKITNAGADVNHFPDLIRQSSFNFKIREIVADKGYLSRLNAQVAKDIGAEPYIMPRKDTRTRMIVTRGGIGIAWRDMIRFWRDNREEFERHYHQRSNVESTFSMIKRKFLPYVRSKNFKAQENEILCKIVCHNASVLVNSVFELGASLDFKKILG